MAEKLAFNLQYNLLTLLCYDGDRGKIIRNSIDIDLFEDDFKTVAERAYDYIEKHDAVPGDHISDVCHDLLNEGDEKQIKSFERLIDGIWESRNGINGEYVMTQLSAFTRKQHMKSGIIQAAELLQSSDDEESLDHAEEILSESMRRRLDLFNPGFRLSDLGKGLEALKSIGDSFPTGIQSFDHRGLGPIRKGLHLFIAPPKKGKTWWLVNLGKRAIMHRKKVCHISLEMSDSLMMLRYYQALFSMSKKKGNYPQTLFERDIDNDLEGFDRMIQKPKLAFDNPKIESLLGAKIDRWGIRLDRLIVKEFPTGDLTVPQLEAYLDGLEATTGFVPDMLIVDYADLMSINSTNYRVDLGKIYKDLRGVGVKKNIAVATASQSNRVGADSKKVTSTNVAEDFSKIATADAVITYNQTAEEKQLGLARLYVSEARSDEDKFSVVITQNYALGQFVLDSVYMPHGFEYFEEINKVDP